MLKRTLILLSLIFIQSSHICGQKLNEFQTYFGDENFNLLNEFVQSYDSFIYRNFEDQKTYRKKVYTFLFQTVYDSTGQKTGYSRHGSYAKDWGIDSAYAKKLTERYAKSELRKEFIVNNYELNTLNREFEKNYIKGIFIRDSLERVKSGKELIDLAGVEDDFYDIELDSIEQKVWDSLNSIWQRREDSIYAQYFINEDSLYHYNPYSKFLIGVHRYSRNKFLEKAVESVLNGGDVSRDVYANGFIYWKNKVSYKNYYVKAFISMHIYIDCLIYYSGQDFKKFIKSLQGD